jgi:spore coat protein U domain-containing protein, fimbrial subunit CupE1/2/3/6
MNRWLSNALAVLALSTSTLIGGSALAGTATKDFDVTAVVDAQCSIDAVNIDFGVYDVFGTTDKTANGSVTVRCTKGATVSIDLNDGMNGPARKMSNGSATLAYDLYSDAGLATRWGAGANGVNPYAPSATSTSTAATVTTVYGNLPQGQTNATPGSYTDTITATVNF